MSLRVILELPEDLAQRIRTAAARSHRAFEDVVVEYIQRGAAESPLELLPDADVVALCDAAMAESQQSELGLLQEKNREGQLLPDERGRLEELMQVYRSGLVRKAQALRVAVQRGLRPPLQ
ncbi:MAG: hypothetical protein K2R98_16410 [Gemmataceae bacterium]|nr:hypothetical protein [Gemmataceae bacterium]